MVTFVLGIHLAMPFTQRTNLIQMHDFLFSGGTSLGLELPFFLKRLTSQSDLRMLSGTPPAVET